MRENAKEQFLHAFIFEKEIGTVLQLFNELKCNFDRQTNRAFYQAMRGSTLTIGGSEKKKGFERQFVGLGWD